MTERLKSKYFHLLQRKGWSIHNRVPFCSKYYDIIVKIEYNIDKYLIIIKH